MCDYEFYTHYNFTTATYYDVYVFHWWPPRPLMTTTKATHLESFRVPPALFLNYVHVYIYGVFFRFKLNDIYHIYHVKLSSKFILVLMQRYNHYKIVVQTIYDHCSIVVIRVISFSITLSHVSLKEPYLVLVYWWSIIYNNPLSAGTDIRRQHLTSKTSHADV